MGPGDAAGDLREIVWLVLRAQAGDRAALEQLLRVTQKKIGGYVRVMIGDADLASDVVQQVLITTYRKLHTLQEPRAYWGWVRRIASRSIMAALGARRRDEEMHPPLSDDVAERAAAPAELQSWVPDVLRTLPPASREVMVLHYSEGLSLEEIAAVLDLRIGTVKSRLAYGLRALRRQVSP